MAIGASGLCLLALFIRCRDAFVLPQFYAEEGKYFFADAYNDGWRSLAYTANGYFHLFPRLLANLLISLRVPYVLIPTVFVYACLPVYGLLWWLIFTRLRLPLGARALLVLTTVLVPIGNEIFMNQTNIQWVMALFPAVLYCGEEARSRVGRASDAVVLSLSLFTGPQALLLAPVFLADAFLHRELGRRRIFLTILSTAALATLVGVWLLGDVSRFDAGDGPRLFAFLQFLFRSYTFPVISTAVNGVPTWAVVASVAFLVPLGIACWVFIRRSGERLASVAFLSGPPILLATMFIYRDSPFIPSPYGYAVRNFYLPMVFLLWSLIAATRWDRRTTALWAAAFTWFAFQLPLLPRNPAMPFFTPDLGWESYAEGLSRGRGETVPILPPNWDGGPFMELEPKP